MSKEKWCPSEYRFFFSSLGLIDYNSGNNFKDTYAVLLDSSHNGIIDWGKMHKLFSNEDTSKDQDVRKRTTFPKAKFTITDAIYRIYEMIDELAMNTEDVVVSPSAINAVAREAEETGKFWLERQEKQLLAKNSHEIWVEVAKKFKDLSARCLTNQKRKFMREKARREKLNTPPPDWFIKILVLIVIIIPIVIVFAPRHWYK